MSYISPNDFFNDVIGKAIDMDGVYGAQCVDLFKYFNKIVNNYTNYTCAPSGYAKSLYENRANNGLMAYYDEGSVASLKDGDWCIWGNCKACPDSHVAMFRVNNGNGTGIFLGQNQTSVQNTTQINIPFDGIIGVLRPKIYVTQFVGSPVSRDENKDQVEVIVDKLRCRMSPNGDILGYVNKGIYNYSSSKEQDNYIWLEIGRDMWIATQDDWTKIYPKKEQEASVNNPDIVDDSNMKDEIEKQKITIKNLEDKIAALQKEMQQNPTLIFECPATNDYVIKLYEKEKLYLKKD